MFTVYWIGILTGEGCPTTSNNPSLCTFITYIIMFNLSIIFSNQSVGQKLVGSLAISPAGGVNCHLWSLRSPTPSVSFPITIHTNQLFWLWYHLASTRTSLTRTHFCRILCFLRKTTKPRVCIAMRWSYRYSKISIFVVHCTVTIAEY